jgi:AcrR family transcriptional regulator
MPKIIDHDERRKQVAEATWRVIAKVGLEGATIRMIATEAGYSTGSLHHYFANKDELILFAMNLTWQRTDDRLAEVARTSNALQALSAAVDAILPLDEERRQDVLVWLAFAAQAVNHEAMATAHCGYYLRVRERWRDLLTAGIADGSVRADIDVELEANILIGLIDGVALQAMFEPMTAAGMTAIVQGQIQTLANL